MTKAKNKKIAEVDRRSLPGEELQSPPRSSVLTPLQNPELVFGLVGPIGVNLDLAIDALKSQLKAFNYPAHVVRLSEQIEDFFSSSHGNKSEDQRINALMKEGTKLRVEGEQGAAVAILGLAAIRQIRDDKSGGEPARQAFILRSLKHPKEIEMLRAVYGKGFFLISVYSPRDVRVTALAEKISRSQFGSSINARSKAESLVQRDEQEESTPLGQDVKDAFPLADLFVDGRNRTTTDSQVGRFLQLLFGNIFLTPTRDEHGIYHAKSAALRSADLNRQVGAAILKPEGDIIAVGCNDVPKSGGDLYWPGDSGDARDFQKGVDSMADERIQVLGEMLEKLSSGGLLSSKIASKDIGILVKSLISGEKKKVLKNSRIMNLLEFGRSVHAEMAALMSAARLGVSVSGATLYCTTFPCHMCARHIVASGIKRVVYVEPYPKSKAKQLHQDSISVDAPAPSRTQVNFEPFQGIAPRQYQEIFDPKNPRKDDEGRAVDWREASDQPRVVRFINSYLQLEEAIVGSEIPRLLVKLGVKLSLDPKRSGGK
ncbi:anti-phage dCTP deaminase [Pseudomonas protegens]|uniref:anti-phage dCTP deaminase n=1 Tax=Pseudomonas protegens TaxID=380021 RepID=UPI002749B126|nr:anti-phage dCTP deaminase [Pseudomonas protegens]MDP9536133.1 anti-phage dCTP deaminase [Pseudomonas protegens]